MNALFMIHKLAAFIAVACALISVTCANPFPQPALATASPLGGPGLPYPLVPALFHGTFKGHDYAINGTIDDVEDHLDRLFPEEQLKNSTLLAAKAKAWSATSNTSGLLSRSKLPPRCNERRDWHKAYAAPAYEEAYRIQREGGRATVGPYSCARLGCRRSSDGWGAQIVVCNDRSNAIDPARAYLATYAFESHDVCQFYDIKWGFVFKSQQFDTDGYNVIVNGIFECQ